MKTQKQEFEIGKRHLANRGKPVGVARSLAQRLEGEFKFCIEKDFYDCFIFR
jgi:hypothetical protein